MQKTNASDSVCPVCHARGTFVKHLSSEFILASLAGYFGTPVPAEVPVSEYDILRCTKCLLEYAAPMVPGDDAFYSWIASFNDYYPATRWEWRVALAEMMGIGPVQKSLLDVGCGSGQFLKLASALLPGVAAIGLDPTNSALQQCTTAGIEAYGETLQQYAANVDHTRKQFDFICAFHCLEHVASPRELLEAVIQLTHAQSRIFLSTPYSPMSFETNWYDPLNHPPHHMTRWNATAYNELAAQVGWSVDLLAPPPANLAVRTLIAVNLAVHGPRRRTPHRLITSLLHPVTTGREIRRQMARETLFGKSAPDVVLARFHRNL